MGSRLVLAFGCALLGACASAGQPDPTALGTDASVPPDACGDTDNDGVCNADDTCMGFPDSADADADTVADGCDQCPGVDDRIDVNTNSVPDCKEAVTRTIDLKVVGTNKWRGWYSSVSAHSTTNDNTITGTFSNGTFNSYYVFSLTGFTASVITSVTLELQMELYNGAATETLSVWDVTTPAATVENGTTSAAILADLQADNKYANATISNAQLTQIISIPLNAKAAQDATAKRNDDFVIGVHVDTAGYVRFGDVPNSQGNPNTVNRITIKYLP